MGAASSSARLQGLASTPPSSLRILLDPHALLPSPHLRSESCPSLSQPAERNFIGHPLLLRGSKVVRIPDDGAPPHPVFLFQGPAHPCPEQPRFASLIWCSDEEKDGTAAAASHALHLAQLTDIFMGKQLPRFTAADVAALPSSRCVSLGDSAGRLLHLVFPRADDRAAWLKALHVVFTGQLRDMPPLGGVSPYHPAVPESLEAGVTCLVMEELGPPRLVDLWWVPPEEGSQLLGVLYWDEVGRRAAIEERSLPLLTLLQVHLGKQHPRLQQLDAVQYPASQCFSLSSATRQVHVVFFCVGHRRRWVALLQKEAAEVVGPQVTKRWKSATASPSQGATLHQMLEEDDGHYCES